MDKTADENENMTAPKKDYSWIKVPKERNAPSKSWEERYKELGKHYIEEATFLINKTKELSQPKEN